MRVILALIAALTLAAPIGACGHSEPQPYPAPAQAEFFRSCPQENAVCACTWDRITRDMSYEEYQAAMERFRETGRMEPTLTHARTICTERHPS